MISDAPNINRLWADLIVDELVRNGVRSFCLAPGSRSTPLATAVAAHPEADAVLHVDERGTAFFALGLARATGRPAAWITTSGTAVANGLPAVVEAATDRIPLLLLTADRPPELRDTGANQTIDQVRLFEGYVRWQVDLPAPDPALDPAFVLTTVDQAVYRSLRMPAGPVHLNTMFREPLAPLADGSANAAIRRLPASWTQGRAPYTRYTPARTHPDAAGLRALAGALRTARRGLLTVGRLTPGTDTVPVMDLALALGWPVLPDIASQLRLTAAPQVVSYYDVLLADASFAAARAPDAVLHLGAASTSKRLLRFIEQHRPAVHAVVQEAPGRLDPSHRATHHLEADIPAFCTALIEILGDQQPGEPPADTNGAVEVDAPADEVSAWAAGWQAASDRAGAALQAFFEAEGTLSEPCAARLVTRLMPASHGLFLASSMPVRDVDAFAEPGEGARPVAANRGASGIDGTVATAAGFARGLGRPVTLLIGDLALLHDLNSLALLRACADPFVVVLINNDGGGIFSFLPIAGYPEVFEPYFGTPHGLTFEAAAGLFGLAYAAPATPDAFSEAYEAACRRPGATLIEVRTDRRENRALHDRLLSQTVLDELRAQGRQEG